MGENRTQACPTTRARLRGPLAVALGTAVALGLSACAEPDRTGAEKARDQWVQALNRPGAQLKETNTVKCPDGKGRQALARAEVQWSGAPRQADLERAAAELGYNNRDWRSVSTNGQPALSVGADAGENVDITVEGSLVRVAAFGPCS